MNDRPTLIKRISPEGKVKGGRRPPPARYRHPDTGLEAGPGAVLDDWVAHYGQATVDTWRIA